MKNVTIYTDGACLGNPGKGGWAAILSLDNTPHRKEIFGGFLNTTNNRMELFAVISALSILKNPCNAMIYTDSKYVADAISKGWLKSWEKNNWKKSDKQSVKNIDLWVKLSELLNIHNVKFKWLKGHCGYVDNEICDSLAKQAAISDNLSIDEGYKENS